MPLIRWFSLSSYKVIRKLDEGGIATIYLVKCIETGEIAVAKVPRHKYVDLIEKEIAILKHLRSVEGVPRFIDRKWYYEEGVPVLILEYIEGAPLARIMRYMYSKSSYILKIFLDLVNIVQHIHKLGVVHRDITPDNIIVGISEQVKLIDFDAAEFIGSVKGVRVYHGKYTAPEVQNGAVTYSSDVWSLGAILKDLAFLHSLPISMSYLNNRLLVKDPHKRISLEELKNYLSKLYLNLY
jgi:serine/threonine protein kinase